MMGLSTLNARERHAVRMGLGAIAIILATAKGPARLREMEGVARAEYADAAAALYRVRSLRRATSVGSSERSMRIGDGMPIGLEPLLARSESEALSRLAQHVSGLADFSGVQVHEATPRTSDAFEKGIGRVAMRFVMSASSESLLGLLRELELGRTLLRVRRLEVVQRDPGADPGVPEVLRVELEVVALVRLGDDGSRT